MLTFGFSYKGREELLNQLARTVERLELVTVELGILPASDFQAEYDLELEVEDLRHECAVIRAALESR
jgi:hypothetical protein